MKCGRPSLTLPSVHRRVVAGWWESGFASLWAHFLFPLPRSGQISRVPSLCVTVERHREGGALCLFEPTFQWGRLSKDKGREYNLKINVRGMSEETGLRWMASEGCSNWRPGIPGRPPGEGAVLRPEGALRGTEGALVSGEETRAFQEEGTACRTPAGWKSSGGASCLCPVVINGECSGR